MRTFPKAGLLVLALALSACAGTSEGPLESDHTVQFAQIKNSPDSFKGQTAVLGGEVLTAKRLKDGTRIEVLQLPLNSSQVPVADLTQSQGRFVAIQREFLDPATIPHGTRITVDSLSAGVCLSMPLDETEYTYPIIDVRDLKVWPQMAEAPMYPRPYPYYPYWGPMWGPYWRPYPYW